MTDGSANEEEQPRRRRRKQARPAEIVAAGLAEFAERGFEGARMEDVARRAGIAKGTVFLYFPTKEALFEAALVSRIDPVFDRLGDGAVAQEGASLDLLLALVDRLYAELEGPGLVGLMRVIIAEGRRFPAVLEAYHRLVVARALAMLSAVVARGVAAGEFRAGAVTELPMTLVAPALMPALWRLTFEPIQPMPLERFRAAHVEMIRAALLPGVEH